MAPCVPVYPGRGRRPRRPASRRRLRWRPRVRGAPWTSRPTIITWLASCGTLCSRVSLVGADVPGGPRPRWRLRWHPRVCGAPWTSRPTIITWLASYGTLCSRVPGRGRRLRRPAFPMASPLASPCARRAVDVAPYHNNMVGIIRHLVFPCIPNNMVGIMWYPCVPVYPGRGRRPRRPASRWRLRWRPRVRGEPWTSRPTRITCRRGGHLVFPRTRIRVFNGDHA